MPICLYDGEIYEIESEGIDRKWMLSFFLQGHIEDCLALYEKNGKYRGIVTYRSLLTSTDLESAIYCGRLLLDNTLWQEARRLLDGNRNKTVPVFNQDMEMVYLARFEPDLVDQWEKLQELRERVDCILLKEFINDKNSFHIEGINDVLFALRHWLMALGMKVSVCGEAWGYLE